MLIKRKLIRLWQHTCGRHKHVISLVSQYEKRIVKLASKVDQFNMLMRSLKIKKQYDQIFNHKAKRSKLIDELDFLNKRKSKLLALIKGPIG